MMGNRVRILLLETPLGVPGLPPFESGVVFIKLAQNKHVCKIQGT